MKKKLYLPILCIMAITMLFSCTLKERTKKACDSSENQEYLASKLIKEADSLMQGDSLFWLTPVNRTHAYIPINNAIIKNKLDSALLLSPHLKKAYTSKFVYLVRCWQLLEMLQLLRQMDLKSQEPMDADMRNFKAILEDRYGNKKKAQDDFEKADSIYDVLLRQYKTKELTLYNGYRILKAINFSLMKNDFEYLRKELEYYNNTHKAPINDMESFKKIETKNQYYDYLFKEVSIITDEK